MPHDQNDESRMSLDGAQPEALDSSSGDFQEKTGPLQHPCDLDVLLFFHRFPRVLLTSEKLAKYVGYDIKEVGRSLETLAAAKVITRSLNPTHEARLYVFTADLSHQWLTPVLSVASTQEGRANLIRILKQRGLGAKTELTRNMAARGSS